MHREDAIGMLAVPPSKAWFVLEVPFGEEPSVAHLLERVLSVQGAEFEALLPMITYPRKRGGPSSRLLIGGYLFARTDDWAALLSVKANSECVKSFIPVVGNSLLPATIHPAVMSCFLEALDRWNDQQLAGLPAPEFPRTKAKPVLDLPVGSEVVVQGWGDVIAKLMELRPGRQASIALTIFGRLTNATVPMELLSPAGDH